MTLEAPQPSYNYNELVGKIAAAREAVKNAENNDDRLTHLQESLSHFETLSNVCPMTPLLWMQYAYDAGKLANMAEGKEYNAENFTVDALEIARKILNLGMDEFPGCAVLHLLRLQWAVQTDALKNDDPHQRSLTYAQESLKETLCQGAAHRNEGLIIQQLYKDALPAILQEAARDSDVHILSKSAYDWFVDRARTPMHFDLNAGIIQEYKDFVDEQHSTTETRPLFDKSLHSIEQARRNESALYSQFRTYEDDITIAMQQEGVLSPLLQQPNDAFENVQAALLENNNNSNAWMGMGGMATAQAFINYAQACSHYKDEDEDQQKEVRQLAPFIYERGVAECPTVETLWLSYIQQLYFLYKSKQDPTNVLGELKSATNRGVRNCPYSVKLVQEKLNVMLLLANAGHPGTTFDPEQLYQTTILKETIGNGFIVGDQQVLELFLTTVQVVRRRILGFLSEMAPIKLVESDSKKKKSKKKQEPMLKDYSDPEPLGMPGKGNVTDDDYLVKDATETEANMQELEDLCTDLRELYDEMDEYFRKNHSKFKQGRAKLWQDRGWTETHLVGPVMMCFDHNSAGRKTCLDDDTYSQVTKAFDKATKVMLPVHPSVFQEYIQAVLTSFPETKTPYHVMNKLRQVRFLYQTALKSIGKPKNGAAAVATTTAQPLDFETSLRCLCQDYVDFERYFGSSFSLADAITTTQKKLSRAFAHSEEETSTAKRKMSDVDGNAAMEVDGVELSAESAAKKRKTDHTADTSTSQPKATSLSVPKPAMPKVKVGNMEYPAHPYTIRVSYLSPQTQDMDLVDVFRPKCGGIVHAKIMRDKHSHKSKGWGLVQFEEKESVEKALALEDVMGIDGKSVKIERSHLPAIGLVPPGMHRVNPKGQGKSTKRNQKKKEKESKVGDGDVKMQDAAKEDSKPAAAAASTSNVFAFRPRNVPKKARPKGKIDAPK